MSTPPLLQLAAGYKVRPRKAPVFRPRESVLQMAVAKVLREHCLPDWVWFHVPNGERRDAITGARLKRMGVMPGIPDIVLVSPYGSVRFLELKRAGEFLSEFQEAFRLHCVRQGIPFAVAYDFDQALAALCGWDCLRIKMNSEFPGASNLAKTAVSHARETAVTTSNLRI